MFPDTQCSDDPNVRRFATIGSGVEGVSVVIDRAGDDTYLGRTGTMGAGHIGGVGLLEDRAGNDSYRAMRNGMGLGLSGGAGVLHDVAGDDRYDYYMPRPKDPDAGFHEDGWGGAVDDSGLFSEVGRSPHKPEGVGGRCDDKPRSLQGVGIFVAPANGVLIDNAGEDYYRAAGYRNQASTTSRPRPDPRRRPMAPPTRRVRPRPAWRPSTRPTAVLVVGEVARRSPLASRVICAARGGWGYTGGVAVGQDARSGAA